MSDVVETFAMAGLALLVFAIATTSGSGWFVLFAGAVLIVTVWEFAAALFRWLLGR